jgi:hypothetical protein
MKYGFIILSLFIIVVLKAQLHGYAGAGATNAKWGMELNVGYRHSQGAIGVAITQKITA